MDNRQFTYIYLRRQTEAGINMEVRASIEKRRSIRKFKDTPDMRPRKKMDEVLEYRGFGCVQEEGVKTS